jgi:hypothetical protein
MKLNSRFVVLGAQTQGEAPDARAKKYARAHNQMKGALRIRRTTSKKLRGHAKRAELNSWFLFGEAYSAFRDWRPIPAALLSHSVELVPGPKNSLPTTHPKNRMAVQKGGKYP